MKISNMNKNINEVNQLNNHSKRNAVSEAPRFGEELEKAGNLKYNQTLIDLTKSIVKQGEVIVNHCDIKEFKKYKELISSFFKEITSSGFEFNKDGKTNGKNRGNIYANIKKVDAKMDILAQELLKGQKDQVSILNMVEDIRGIVLDTFM